MEVIKKCKLSAPGFCPSKLSKKLREVKTSSVYHPQQYFFSFRIYLVMIQCICYKEHYLFILSCCRALKYHTIFRGKRVEGWCITKVECKVQMLNYSCSGDLNLEFHDKTVPVTLSTASMSLS